MPRLQASLAGDEISGTGVLRHVMRILVTHVDHCRPDLDAFGLRADGRQEGKRRGELAGEVMDPKIGSISAPIPRRQRQGRWIAGACPPPSGSA